LIDRFVRPLIDPPLWRAGVFLAAMGVSANALTIGGFVLGAAAVFAISIGHFALALVLLIANRLADGLDGAVARVTRRTDRGAFLDIVLDFAIYTAVPLGFAIWNPVTNALPAAILLATYVANGTAFLAFAVMAQKRGLETFAQGDKSIYYLAGLAEGTETVIFMIAVCLLPAAFPAFAIIFAMLCFVSAVGRIVLAWTMLD
jgi:phosphatidylglycerophosphate synthase